MSRWVCERLVDFTKAVRDDKYAIQIITKLFDTMESNISDASC